MRRRPMSNAEQGVSRANAEWLYANNNLHRVEPLLAKQYVTVDRWTRRARWKLRAQRR